MKRLLLESYFNAAGSQEMLSEFQKQRLSTAETLDELHQIVGKDFYVVMVYYTVADTLLVYNNFERIYSLVRAAGTHQ